MRDCSVCVWVGRRIYPWARSRSPYLSMGTELVASGQPQKHRRLVALRERAREALLPSDNNTAAASCTYINTHTHPQSQARAHARGCLESDAYSRQAVVVAARGGVRVCVCVRRTAWQTGRQVGVCVVSSGAHARCAYACAGSPADPGCDGWPSLTVCRRHGAGVCAPHYTPSLLRKPGMLDVELCVPSPFAGRRPPPPEPVVCMYGVLRMSTSSPARTYTSAVPRPARRASRGYLYMYYHRTRRPAQVRGSRSLARGRVCSVLLAGATAPRRHVCITLYTP